MAIDPKTPLPPSFAGNDPSPDAFSKHLQDAQERKTAEAREALSTDIITEKTYIGPDEREKAQLEAVERDSHKRQYGEASAGPIRPPVIPPFKSQPQPLPDMPREEADNMIALLVELHNDLKKYGPNRSLSLVATKIDEARLWLHEFMNR